MPDDFDEKIKTLIGNIVDETPPLSPLNIREAEIPKRTKTNVIVRDRRAWLGFGAAIAAIVVILVMGLPSAPGSIDDSVLGLRISSASAAQVQQPGVGITLTTSYMLPGFSIASSSRSTNASDPVNSVQSAIYSPEGKTTYDGEQITIQVQPESTIQVNKSGPRKGSSPGPLIDGAQTYFSSTTAHYPNPPLSECTIQDNQKGATIPIASEVLSWNEKSAVSGIDYQYWIAYRGAKPLSESQLVRIGTGIQDLSNSWSCWTLRDGLLHQVKSSGACAIGEVDRPLLKPLSAGATKIAQGTLFGSSWYYEAAVMECPAQLYHADRYAVTSQLVGTNGVNCVATGRDSSPNAAQVYVDELPNGERLACGYLPSAVTSVSARASSGPEVTENVFPKHVGNKSFFAMSLGKIGAACYYVCHGSVTLKFYAGTRLVSSQFIGTHATNDSGLGFTISSSKLGEPKR